VNHNNTAKSYESEHISFYITQLDLTALIFRLFLQARKPHFSEKDKAQMQPKREIQTPD
jgi:hypothetical protein